jgi:proteic killer suppression protein
MIVGFKDQTTQDIFHGTNTKAARRIPVIIWKIACRKLDMLNAAHALHDLVVPWGNQLERLKGHLTGWHSIRINDQYRITFKWHDGTASDVHMTDYH